MGLMHLSQFLDGAEVFPSFRVETKVEGVCRGVLHLLAEVSDPGLFDLIILNFRAVLHHTVFSPLQRPFLLLPLSPKEQYRSV